MLYHIYYLGEKVIPCYNLNKQGGIIMETIEFLEDCQITNVDLVYDKFRCKSHHWAFLVSENIQNMRDFHTLNKIYNIIYEWLLSKGMCCVFENKDYLWWFYFDDTNSVVDAEPYYINVANLLSSYPETFMDRVKRVMLNLSFSSSNYGDVISLGDELDTHRLLMNELINEDGEVSFVRTLSDLGYVNEENDYYNIVITADGWKYIDELKKKNAEISQGFLAMQFGEQTADIRETFKRAISDSGYIVSVIDEKEHNNQIVPEIFYEIQRSKFMVVDVTFPNYGAYYEAGYGQALGKEVIVCCNEESFNSNDKAKRPHFDIAQKSTIVWKDLDDLYKRLKRRIEATVK